MKYIKEPLQLDNPLEFWLNFEGEERVFWVDRQSDRVVVGAKRWRWYKMISTGNNMRTYFMGAPSSLL